MREAPYNRLKRITAQWIADKILYRHRKLKWKLECDTSYSFKHLGEVVRTANELGYNLEIKMCKDGEHYEVWYAKKLPTELPWELR